MMSKEVFSRRVNITLNHLSGTSTNKESEINNSVSSSLSTTISRQDCYSKVDAKRTDVEALNAWIEGDYAGIKKKARHILLNLDLPHIHDSDELEYHEQRKLLNDWLKKVASNLPFSIKILRDDFATYAAFSEVLSFLENNLSVKFSVQYSLFAGCIVNLGTAYHHQMIPKIQSIEIPGCFGMTEKGHGSNVRGIETTSTYDANTDEFIINTPNKKAMKTWIGGSGFAQKCAVFANLHIGGENKGVHVFVVDMRDQNGNVLKGVTVEDVGYKFGLNGIDNMSIHFDHVRIPRCNMLNRFSEVNEDGKYINKVGSASKHFGHTVGELSGGRVSISALSIGVAKTALTIATRYGFTRKQFTGADKNEEILLMKYPTHYGRIMPHLARTLAAIPFLNKLMKDFNMRDEDPKTIPYLHSTTSISKAALSWDTIEMLSILRQCCGGAGYRAPSKISKLIRDSHVFVTFEGDNTVLCQQTAKYLLSLYSKGKARGGKYEGVLSYANSEGELYVGHDKKDDILANEKYQLFLFQQREWTLLNELADRINQKMKETKNSWAAFHENIPLAVQLALAHADRIIHQEFIESFYTCSFKIQESLRVALKLHGLTQIRNGLGWFTSNEFISPSNARSVETLFYKYCSELSEYSLDIVEAFDVPKEWLPNSDLSDY